jgi:hypothetical protein
MLQILSADAGHQIDPTAWDNLYKHLPQTTDPSAPLLVPVSHFGNYRFNTGLPINRRVILVDFMEYFGFQPISTTCRLGLDPLPINLANDPEWQKLDQWVRHMREKNLIIADFKRELFQDCTDPNVHPIEWPCYLPAWEIESKAAFDRRPFDLFYSWGYSNALRPAWQAGAFNLMAEGKIEVISAWEHIAAKQHEPQPKWICMHNPHTHRIPINDLARLQAMSKCSVSLPGSGVVCFRSTEAPLHTVPVIHDYGRQWSYPWIHYVNCIGNDPTAEDAYDFLNECPDDFHGLYVAAQETLDRYRTHRYVNEYVVPTIKRYL